MSVDLESIWGNMAFVQYPERLGQFRLPVPGNPKKTYIAGSSEEEALKNLQGMDAKAAIVMTGKGLKPNDYLNYQGKSIKVTSDFVEHLNANGIPVFGCHFVTDWSKTQLLSAARRNHLLGVQGLIWDVEFPKDLKNCEINAPAAISATRQAFPDLTMGVVTWAQFLNEKHQQIHSIPLAQAMLCLPEIELGIPMVCPKNVVKVGPNKNVRLDVVKLFETKLHNSLSEWSTYLPSKSMWIWYPSYTGEGTSVFGADINPMVGLIAQAISLYPALDIRGPAPWNTDHANRYNASYGCLDALKQVDYSVFRGNVSPSPSNS